MAATQDVYFGKRTYHERNDSPYMIPNDSLEHDRLDIQHAGFHSMLGGRSTLLRKDMMSDSIPTKALDLGCGSGSATLDLARYYGPDARIYGLDLSVVPETTRHRAPPNVTWAQGHFLNDELKMTGKDGTRIFQLNSFSHIFARALVYGIDDWPGLYSRAFELLAPGGWMERQDPDMVWYQLDPTSPNGRRDIDQEWVWPDVHREASRKRGLDMYCGSNAAGQMRKAGFVDVQVKEFTYTCNRLEGHPELDAGVDTWHKTMPLIIGKISMDTMTDVGWSKERIQKECVDRIADDFFKNEAIFLRYIVTLGRKPLEGEVVKNGVE